MKKHLEKNPFRKRIHTTTTKNARKSETNIDTDPRRTRLGKGTSSYQRKNVKMTFSSPQVQVRNPYFVKSKHYTVINKDIEYGRRSST